MPIHPDTLSVLASEYVTGMTSIRGRRVQRLLKREFAIPSEARILISLATQPLAALNAHGA
jgi:hypothetical protein